MKKKLIIALAATLILGQASFTTQAFATTNKNTVQTISENQKQVYKNRIFVRGIDIQSHAYHGAYIDFDVTDPQNKKLVVNDMKGEQYAIHPNFRDYFSVKLYDAYGNLKKEVSLHGWDNLSKLNELNDTPFEYGDYLKFTHAEPKNRLTVSGSVIGGFSDPKLYPWVLQQYHHEITEEGLKLVYETGGVSTVQESYWDDTYDNSTFALNTKFGIKQNTFDSSYSEKLLIKDKDGKVVQEVDGYSLNWYSEDPNNYNGAQYILNKSVFENLKEGKYTFVTRVMKDGKKVTDIALTQNENTNPLARYIVNRNINDNGTQTIGDKTYTFKTEYSRTGQVFLEVKNISQN